VVRAIFGFAVVAAVLIVAGCESAPESSGPPLSPFTAGEHLKMNGEKDGVVVPVLNVWNTVPPSEAVCTLQHGVLVTVTEMKYNATDTHWWAKIDNGAGCAGWVPETSLKK
jgi:hypothetical protein